MSSHLMYAFPILGSLFSVSVVIQTYGWYCGAFGRVGNTGIEMLADNRVCNAITSVLTVSIFCCVFGVELGEPGDEFTKRSVSPVREKNNISVEIFHQENSELPIRRKFMSTRQTLT